MKTASTVNRCVDFTAFLPKSGESKFSQFPHCFIYLNRTKTNLATYSTHICNEGKKIDITSNMNAFNLQIQFRKHEIKHVE